MGCCRVAADVNTLWGAGPVQPGCCAPAVTPSLQALEVCRLCHVFWRGCMLVDSWELCCLSGDALHVSAPAYLLDVDFLAS